MNTADKRRQFMTVLNLILTALILLGVIIVAGWLLMLDRQINQISSAAGELAMQLTLESTLAAYEVEIITQSETEEEGAFYETDTVEPTPKTTNAPTITPKPTHSELNQTFYQNISLVPSPMLNELSNTQYFRLPPMRIDLPEGWRYRFDTAGSLTITDSFDNETQMKIWAVNTQGEFLLNQIGVFNSLADGGLAWFPDTTPRQGLGAGQYEINFQIAEFSSDPLLITIHDAPMARILEAIPMYRTYDDIEEDRRYLSFASQQEPMSMFGYAITPDGTLYIRLWRAHDKNYYWVNGEFVMHPEKGMLYNDLEDLKDGNGQDIVPKIEISTR